MASRAHKIIDEFFTLSLDEQAEVLDAIVPADELDDPEFSAELHRRLKSVEDGTAVLIDGEEAMARLHTKYAKQ
jgi:hypothetical protein